MGLLDKATRWAASAAEQATPATVEKAAAGVRDERTPYCGFETNQHGNATGRAESGPHLLVLAGSGAGKSRRVLVPQIVTWDGPVCAVSSKSDLAEMSAKLRGRRGGPLYVMDLTGQADWDSIPDRAIPVINDPCSLLIPDTSGSTDDSALALATLLLQVGSLGMSATGGGGGDSGFWATLALRTLAALLQAGGWYPDPETGEPIWGGGIGWVLEAAINYGEIGEEKPESDDDDEDEPVFDEPADLETPSWDTAALRGALIGSAHAMELGASKALDARQRDSIGINLRVALSPWQLRTVRGTGGEGAVAFTPELLEDPGATFYLISPSSGSAAGAATAVIESLVSHWTLNAIQKGLPKIAMVIDECPQICPIPRLSEHIGLMRSYGCHFTVAAQHSSQFEPRWGAAGMKILLNVFPAVLIGIGAIEKDLLEQAAWTEPPTERQVASRDAGGRASYSADRVESLHPAELLPRYQGEGRLLLRGRQGRRVKLVDYSEM